MTSSEQSRLDEAMQRADDLLLSSLKKAERRRRSRLIAAFILGGIMIAAICFGIAAMLAQPAAPPAQQGDAQQQVDPLQQSQQLAQEGWQLFSARRPDQALGKFQQATQLNPQNTAAWNGLGWAQFNTGNADQAKTAFEKVLQLEPDHAAALNGLGQINLAQRKYDDAEKYLLKASPRAPAAWYGLARLYLLQGKFDDAEKWAQKMVNSGQADETAKQMLAAAKDKKLSDELRMSIEPPAPSTPATQPGS